jgi:hypothetical protein
MRRVCAASLRVKNYFLVSLLIMEDFFSLTLFNQFPSVMALHQSSCAACNDHASVVLEKFTPKKKAMMCVLCVFNSMRFNYVLFLLVVGRK